MQAALPQRAGRAGLAKTQTQRNPTYGILPNISCYTPNTPQQYSSTITSSPFFQELHSDQRQSLTAFQNPICTRIPRNDHFYRERAYNRFHGTRWCRSVPRPSHTEHSNQQLAISPQAYSARAYARQSSHNLHQSVDRKQQRRHVRIAYLVQILKPS